MHLFDSKNGITILPNYFSKTLGSILVIKSDILTNELIKDGNPKTNDFIEIILKKHLP